MAPQPALTPFFDPGASVHFTAPDASIAVRHDLFPAEVCFTAQALPGAQAADIVLPKCRALISPDAVYVFTDGPRGPVLAFYDRLDDISGDPRAGFTLTPSSPATHSVSSLTVEPTNRCGCGSRLRGYRPFGRISYIPSR